MTLIEHFLRLVDNYTSKKTAKLFLFFTQF